MKRNDRVMFTLGGAAGRMVEARVLKVHRRDDQETTCRVSPSLARGNLCWRKRRRRAFEGGIPRRTMCSANEELQGLKEVKEGNEDV